MGEKNGGILAAMILGEKSEMDAEVKELYQNNYIISEYKEILLKLDEICER